MLKMMAETERLIFFENCYARFMWVELEQDMIWQEAYGAQDKARVIIQTRNDEI